MKLNAGYRRLVLGNFSTLLKISCKAFLAIKTNALQSHKEKLSDVFVKLIRGCFTGYESLHGPERSEMREFFFGCSNGKPIHCDNDFSPLTTDRIVRLFVQTLASGSTFTPLHVGLKSEESHPIQLADVLCGASKTLIREGSYGENGLRQIPFDNKLKGAGKGAKVFFWKYD